MSALRLARAALAGGIALCAAVMIAGYAGLIDPLGGILLGFAAVVGMVLSAVACLLAQALGHFRR